MLGRARSHPGEFTLAVFDDLPGEAWELASTWVTGESSFVAVGHSDRRAPELPGSLLVHCVQTAAARDASEESISEAEVLERLWRGFGEERARLGRDHSPEDFH